MKKRKQMTPEEEAALVKEEGEMVEMKKANPVVNTIINVVLIAAIILAAVCTYVSFVSTSGNGVPSIFGIRPFSIQTDSMYPTLKPGDLIVDTAVRDISELEKGDIITYWTVINGERVLNTHRIEQIYDGGGYRIFETKGDNSSFSDALTVHESEVVGKYSFRIGGIGKVFDYLQSSTGFLLIVVLPVFIFFLYHLVQFFRVLFEYQNVKNRIKYEQERGRNEDIFEAQKQQIQEEKQSQRAAMEAELRAQMKAELMEEIKKQQEMDRLKEEIRQQELEKLKQEIKEQEMQKLREELDLNEKPVEDAVETVEVAEPVETEIIETVDEVVAETEDAEAVGEVAETEDVEAVEEVAEAEDVEAATETEVTEEVAEAEDVETVEETVVETEKETVEVETEKEGSSEE